MRYNIGQSVFEPATKKMETDKLPIPYFEPVLSDGTQIFKPKTLLDQFQQKVEQVSETNGDKDGTKAQKDLNNAKTTRKGFLWALGLTSAYNDNEGI